MTEAKKTIRIRLTASQARLVWGLLDGAMDAGACADGLTAAENEACSIVADALLRAATEGAKG